MLAEVDGVPHPKLTDFGVSRVPRDSGLEHGAQSVLTTRAGMFVGTPEYVSPEQARGIPDVDSRADIFAMGVVMYEALTGSMPFQAHAIGDLIIRIVSMDHRPATELGVPTDASAIIDRALAKDPEDRYQTATEMRAAIHGLK